jgi:hypothetical protein
VSTSAQIGSKILHDGMKCDVQRIVHSWTLFQDAKETYILEEQYAQVLSETGKIIFLTFSQTKHPFQNTDHVKGLDPKVWKPF